MPARTPEEIRKHPKVLAAYGCLAPRVVTGQFDPTLIQAFQRCAPQWEKIHREFSD